MTEIKLTAGGKIPETESADPARRAKVSILNEFDGAAFKVGDSLTFEGHADDCGTTAAVEFSQDGGVIRASCAAKGAAKVKWVHWSFGYRPEKAGTFRPQARSRREP